MKIISFLAELAENNNKDWFDSNREEYTIARKEMVDFTAELLKSLSHTNPWASVLSPSKCLYRINRDIRFSNDKTHTKPVWEFLLHLEDAARVMQAITCIWNQKNSFIGGGVYAPQPAVLRALRQEIYFRADDFIKIINASDFKAYFDQLMDERLKRPPKGFPSDFEHIELLKYKHFVVSHPIPEETIAAPPQLIKKTTTYF